MFELMGRDIPAEARKVMTEQAKDIVKTAKWYAPVDKYRLTRAIKLLPAQGNQYSLRLTIVVKGTVEGRSVDKYAVWVHEYPWSKRGPLTRAKGPQAGPRYIKRAVDDHKRDLIKELEAAMARGIKQAVQSSGVNSGKKRSRSRR